MSLFVENFVISCSHDKRGTKNMKHKEKQENFLTSEYRLGGEIVREWKPLQA
jgi:hypothetical protein